MLGIPGRTIDRVLQRLVLRCRSGVALDATTPIGGTEAGSSSGLAAKSPVDVVQ